MLSLLYLILIAAVVCLIVFQTNRSIFVRSTGLFLILAAGFMIQFQFRETPRFDVILALCLFLVLGFATDYYAASLRTWYFQVSDQAVWGLMIGSFVGLFMHSLFPSLLPFLSGALLGALIGEVRARGFRSGPQLGKAVMGTFAGVFGMSAKLLLGMEMIYWLLIFR